VKIILKEWQFNKILNEELGISDEIAKKANEFFNILENDISDNIENFEKERCFSSYNGYLDYDFFGIKIGISYKTINYYTKEYYHKFGVDCEGWSGFDKRYCIMGLFVPCISGTVIKCEVVDTIQHEFEHIYQQYLIGGPFPDSKVYSSILTNMNSNEKFVSDIARMVYGCTKNEQDGYVNGMYAYMMAVPEIFSYEAMKKTPCYKVYNEILTIYENFKNDENFEKELKKYKLSKNTIKKSLDNFGRKIARVSAKIKKDKFEKQGFRI
jgi:hypothetical protein